MPSIQFNSLELNSLAVTTTAAGFRSLAPAPQLTLTSSVRVPVALLPGRAFKIDLPDSEQRMKFHWTPPEANSIGTCASIFIISKKSV